MSPAPRPQGIGSRTVRPALPKAPPLHKLPDPPLELARITELDVVLAAKLGMEPHEVNLMWLFAQSEQENEVVLGHVKRLFASIKLTSDDYLKTVAHAARVIEGHHAAVRSVEAMNANSMKRFAEEYDKFEKDSNEEFHAVNRAYLAFMRRLREGMEWDRVSTEQRELLKQMQAHDTPLDIVRFRSMWIGAKMARLDSDIPKLSQTSPFYGWARLLLAE